MTGRIERAQKELDLTVRWTAFPLHPETPEAGRSLEDLFAGRGVDIPAVLARLKSTAAGLGLPFTARSMTYNSRRAQVLGKWAEAEGRGDAFHLLAFEAYFAHGRNIALMDVLMELAAAVGLDPQVARTVLDEGRFETAVDQDWQRSREMGITAVPTFQMGGRRLVGAHPYEAIRDLALAAGATPRGG
ncbi:MAG: DsbA family protein [Desulfobacterales bacterium]|nr:DsbA family protein [Desulfobacterales bacterium]